VSGKKNPNNAGRLNVLRAYRQYPSGSLSELVRATGLSQTAVYYHLGNLQNEGVITRSTMRKGRKADPQKRAAKRASLPKAIDKKDALQKRIEKVVRMAKKREGFIGPQNDVVLDSPFRLYSKATKIG
jgi:DNA-binding transcriptional ArsR family regulator